MFTFFCVGLFSATGRLRCSEGPSIETADAPAIFMIGDSTMADKPLRPAQPERGWGQLLPVYFDDAVQVRNRAGNGRSSKSFRDEGRWRPVMDALRPGDFVIIQFGHNDEKKYDPKRYTEAFGSFQENMSRYVREVRSKKGTPILATPIVRRRFNDQGALVDTHGEYPEAVRRAAAELKVPLLDLEKLSRALVQKLGPERSKKLFMWIEPGEYERLPKGRKDDTHLNAFGASRICDLAVREMKAKVPGLEKWLR